MSNVVFHNMIDEANYIYKDWGIYNNPIIVLENMEMHFQKVLPKSIGVPHLHIFNTLYYVTSGCLISLSGDDLSHVDIQPAGSCVCVPKNVIHTLANISDTDAISIVVHNDCDVGEHTIIMKELEELASKKISELNNKMNNLK